MGAVKLQGGKKTNLRIISVRSQRRPKVFKKFISRDTVWTRKKRRNSEGGFQAGQDNLCYGKSYLERNKRGGIKTTKQGQKEIYGKPEKRVEKKKSIITTITEKEGCQDLELKDYALRTNRGQEKQ